MYHSETTTTTTDYNEYIAPFPLRRGFTSGKRASTGSDEGMLNSIQAV